MDNEKFTSNHKSSMLSADINDPESKFINLPEADFESALKAAAKPQYYNTTTIGGENLFVEHSTVPEQLAFELKKKAYAEGQKADENFSNTNYSDVPFDAKKLKKSSSHDSYKPLTSRKSPSNSTCVHVDAAVKFPLIKKSSNETSKSEYSNVEFDENCTIFNIVDETIPPNCEDVNNRSKFRRSTRDFLDYSNFGQENDKKSSLGQRNQADDGEENVEMVEMEVLSKKAVFLRNAPPNSNSEFDDETATDRDSTSSKRRSASQRSGRSQEYNLVPSPFYPYNTFSSGLLLSELSEGLVTQRCGNLAAAKLGRFSSPPANNRSTRNALQTKNRRSKRADDDGSIKAEQINGFRGCDSLDSLLVYIEGAEKRQGTTMDDSTLKRGQGGGGKQKRDMKKDKSKKASSIGASCDDDVEDDDLTSSGCLASFTTKVLCKSDDFPVKYQTTDEYYADLVDREEQRGLWFNQELVNAAVEQEQFTQVTSKKQKKHRQVEEKLNAKRSATPPPRQKVAINRRKRRNSYDSSPSNAHGLCNAAVAVSTHDGEDVGVLTTTSLDAEKASTSEETTTTASSGVNSSRLSYAIVVQQRRPRSPFSEGREHVLLSSSTTAKRQASSLNASRSNSPSKASTSNQASSTNQANASTPDLKLIVDYSNAAANSNSNIYHRSSYATAVAKSSPNNNKKEASSEHVPKTEETTTTITTIIERREKANEESRVSTEVKHTAMASSSTVIVESSASFDVVSSPPPSTPSTSTQSHRRYSCPPIRSHVEFLDESGQRGGVGVDASSIEGLTFGFAEDLEEPVPGRPTEDVEEQTNICDSGKLSKNKIDVDDLLNAASALGPASSTSYVCRKLDLSSERVLKDVVHFVNKKWEDFCDTRGVEHYGK